MPLFPRCCALRASLPACASALWPGSAGAARFGAGDRSGRAHLYICAYCDDSLPPAESLLLEPAPVSVDMQLPMVPGGAGLPAAAGPASQHARPHSPSGAQVAYSTELRPALDNPVAVGEQCLHAFCVKKATLQSCAQGGMRIRSRKGRKPQSDMRNWRGPECARLVT